MHTVETAATAATVVPSTPSTLSVPVATLSHVSKRYGHGSKAVTALDGLSLQLNRGEIVALLGPNGAGKSTAVRLLLGLSSPSSGQARIFGQDPRETATRTRIGAMLQVSSVPKTLTVQEHLDLFRSYYPAPLPMPEIIRIAQLEGIEHRQFEKLSGGQKQRLLFGLALCGDPEIIFLDEPTVGMDIEARHGLWAAVRALAARGKTVLLTTHYLEEADALADRVIVMNQGRVISEGTPSELKRRSVTAASAGRKIRCTTALGTQQIWQIPSVIAVEQNGTQTVVMAGNPEAVVRRLLAEDDTLSDLEILAPALEDAFLALTQH